MALSPGKKNFLRAVRKVCTKSMLMSKEKITFLVFFLFL